MLREPPLPVMPGSAWQQPNVAFPEPGLTNDCCELLQEGNKMESLIGSGCDLSSFLQDVYDKVDYLSSLGKTQTAAVRRDADIGVAEAERDAGIRVSAGLC